MSKLLIISLIISILGIFSLILMALIHPPETSTGRVISVRDYNEFKIIALDTNKTVTCFKCDLRINDTIQVQGDIEFYQGKPQINAQIIKKLN